MKEVKKPKIKIIVSMHGGTIDDVCVDSDEVEITDVVFTENSKYLDGEKEFYVKSGPLKGEGIYTHYGPVEKGAAEVFKPVMAAAVRRMRHNNKRTT